MGRPLRMRRWEEAPAAAPAAVPAAVLANLPSMGAALSASVVVAAAAAPGVLEGLLPDQVAAGPWSREVEAPSTLRQTQLCC